MKPSVFVCPLVSSLIAALALTATAVGQNQTVINVNNVEELYAAVNNQNNAGAIVVMASGTYTLAAKDPNQQPRPNGGILDLQPGMALVGQNSYVDFDGDGVWDPRDDNHDGIPDTDRVRGLIFADPASETIIDAGKLNLQGGVGAVRGGQVQCLTVTCINNRVEKLTVRNTNGLLAAIDVFLFVPNATGGEQAEIRDCLVEDGIRGIRLANRQIPNLTSSAVLERNISRRQLGEFGFGIQILNLNPAQSWDVTLRNNRSYGNRVGLFVPGEASNGQVNVLSTGNLYHDNQLGLHIVAGRTGIVYSNTRFTSNLDKIFDNVGPINSGRKGNGVPGFRNFLGGSGGVFAAGGFEPGANRPLSTNNALVLQFLGTTWAGNFQGASLMDLQVYGALALNGGLPGTNNTVQVLLNPGTSGGGPGAFQFIDSEPPEPGTSHTNSVTVVCVNVCN